MGWLQSFSERIGKAIPNEFSKLGGFSKFLNFIPGVGPALNAGVQAVGGIDRGATAYGDTGNIGQGFQSALSGYGRSSDPGMYGSPNANRDIWNTIGQAGNYLPGPGSRSFLPTSGDMPSFMKDLMQNPYLFRKRFPWLDMNQDIFKQW